MRVLRRSSSIQGPEHRSRRTRPTRAPREPGGGVASGHRTEEMSNVDVAWLRMEHPTNLMMVTALLLFDQPVAFARLQATLEDRLLPYRRFRQRVVRRGLRDRPSWEVDPRFALSSHLHRVALPAPGDDDSLQDLVSDLMSTPLDDSKPLWQVHLIENYGGGCAVLARIHHCIADGIALMRLLLTLTDRGRGAGKRPRRGRSRTSGRLESRPRIASRALSLARSGAEGTVAVARLLLRGPDSETTLRGRLGVAKRAVWSEPIELADVKRIGRAIGGTVNDVLVAAVCGALRRYLEARGEAVDGLDVHVALPVNLRADESTAELGNRFGLVFLALPVGVADPLDRLFEVRRRMLALKASPEAHCTLGILDTIGRVSAGAQRLFVDFVAAKTTAVVTNLPGPKERIFLAGAPVRTMLFWVPQSGRVSLGVSILSYAGEVRLGIAADCGLVPRPESIGEAFQREFEILADLTEQPPLARAS